MSYTVRLLDASTWDPFAELVERNNGIFGGCWCTGSHPEGAQRGFDHRAARETLVDKRHRGQGVARAAVEGALEQIAAAGGGRVEAISEVTAARVRQVGKHAWIVNRTVAPARGARPW